MDLETENRIAAILLKEAAELRRQAQSEGALAYLRKPTVRSRPNSRFLTATVRGVQQANRAVEVNEMWRLREKQIELDNRIKARNRDGGCSSRDSSESHRSRYRYGSGEGKSASTCSIPPKERNKVDTIGDEGLRDDEVDEFLHSRTKRGRGAVGSRMDETGPYLSSHPDSETNGTGNSEGELERPQPRVVLGPEKPYSLLSRESTSDEEEEDEEEESRKRAKTSSRKHKSSKEKKKKRRRGSKERERKHHHRHRHK